MNVAHLAKKLKHLHARLAWAEGFAEGRTLFKLDIYLHGQLEENLLIRGDYTKVGGVYIKFDYYVHCKAPSLTLSDFRIVIEHLREMFGGEKLPWNALVVPSEEEFKCPYKEEKFFVINIQ